MGSVADAQENEEGRMSSSSPSAWASSLPSTTLIEPQPPKRSARAPRTPPKRRQRKKPCHVAQKERKLALEQELSALEARVAELRRQAGAPAAAEVQATKERMSDNLQLQSAIRTHEMLIAGAQGSFSGYTSPLSPPLHLPADWAERRRILLGIRDARVRLAHQFLTERTRMMDPWQETCEESTFRSPEGDFCAVKLDNTPLVGVSSVQEALQALRACFQQAEVAMSVASSAVVTREGDEVAGEGISSHRFCATLGESAVMVGKNSVGFTRPVASDAGGPTCIVQAINTVDQDDMYPYRPSERVRSDLSGVVQLRVHRLTPSDVVATTGGPAVAVVMTRWYHIKVHRTQLAVPPSDMALLQSTLVRLLDHMIPGIKAQLYSNVQQHP